MSAETTKHNVVVTRVFDASVAQVWKAWSDPEQVMRWWGPEHFTSPSAEIDFREGGVSLVCMRAPQDFGGQDFYNTWAYTKIVPMELIDFVQNLADKDGNLADPATMGMPPDFPRDQRSTVTLKDLGNGKTELTVTEYDWTPGQMHDMSKLGLEQCLDKMGKSLK